MDEWWIDPMRRAFAGRRVVLAGAKGVSWTEHIDLLRSVGVEQMLVVATDGRGAGPLPDVPTLIIEPPAGMTEMERIHASHRTLADPPPVAVDALERFDPHREALVIGTFLATVSHLDGRPLLARRRPEWVALEDKVVVDSFWDRAGVDRAPSAVVPLFEGEQAASRLDRGQGTVWAADAREGFHGGAHGTRWVTDPASRDRALATLARICDTVRVMPFLEGVPCSIHGIVLPDGIAVLRPVELVTLRRGRDLLYAGCATYWDPAPAIRDAMRAIARRVGEQLRDEVAFRGAFTVDGVVTLDGFRPTELNPRFGAGIMTIARGTGIPMLLVNDLVVAGHDIGRTAEELETDVLAHADARRGGGTWTGTLEHDVDVEARPVGFDGTAWHWATDGPVAGHVTAGDGFVRCIYDQASTPVGPPTAPRAVAFWEFMARELGTATGGLTPASETSGARPQT
ncbi:MAG TPA: hypothetical protein VK853_02905 [Ilumatobacteraceae bacterium]|nr:hypothetical protein [Ilumatobacteraceae bacterium]